MTHFAFQESRAPWPTWKSMTILIFKFKAAQRHIHPLFFSLAPASYILLLPALELYSPSVTAIKRVATWSYTVVMLFYKTTTRTMQNATKMSLKTMTNDNWDHLSSRMLNNTHLQPFRLAMQRSLHPWENWIQALVNIDHLSKNNSKAVRLAFVEVIDSIKSSSVQLFPLKPWSSIYCRLIEIQAIWKGSVSRSLKCYLGNKIIICKNRLQRRNRCLFVTSSVFKAHKYYKGRKIIHRYPVIVFDGMIVLQGFLEGAKLHASSCDVNGHCDCYSRIMSSMLGRDQLDPYCFSILQAV